MKFSVITLGCDKNTVDSERYLAELADRGGEPTDIVEEADVILVNTCGFIDAAKRESIDAIVQAGRLKEAGRAQAVVAVGCMVERHRSELAEALPEVDLFLGASEMDRLVPELVERGFIDDAPVPHPGVRLYSGELPHIRYLKVSEGCDHGCAFCAIPLMRGKHRSFALEDVVREAQLLEAQGAREVNLVAQDLAHFGRDRRGTGESLPTLLEALVRETGIPWIRMLYLYSAGITPRLLELVATEARIMPYFDMPMQHGSDAVLQRMRRPERNSTIREKVARIREIVPDVAIRTTCIVGFPGETDEDFETLLRLLEETQFDRVGAFAYSPQEGTAASDSYEDDVPESLKYERLERLNELQRLITTDCFEQRIGRTVRAMVDRVDGESIEARATWQAHEIDGTTALGSGLWALKPGDVVDARIDGLVDDYDLSAVVMNVVSQSSEPIAPSRPGRALPLASAFGR
ncbi:MAG: 30S ribosomal protein S12 methylthiotransferase RimO [Gemmatimonadaceae bacterium]